MQVGGGLGVAGGTVYVPTVTTSAEFGVSSNYNKYATVAAISSYIDGAVASGQRPIEPGTGILISSGASSDIVSVFSVPLRPSFP